MSEEQKQQLWRENCRSCGKKVYALHQRVVTNDKTGQEYQETECVCPDCDLWVTTRIPVKLANGHIQQSAEESAPA